MSTKNDERVKDYQKMSHGKYILEIIDNERLEDLVKKWNAVPLHLGDFLISNSIRIMNVFFHTIIGFNSNDL